MASASLRLQAIKAHLEQAVKDTDIMNDDSMFGSLQELETMKLSVQELTETKIGKMVNLIRKNTTNKSVKSVAKRLIILWRKLIPHEKSFNSEMNESQDTESIEHDKSAASTSDICYEKHKSSSSLKRHKHKKDSSEQHTMIKRQKTHYSTEKGADNCTKQTKVSHKSGKNNDRTEIDGEIKQDEYEEVPKIEERLREEKTATTEKETFPDPHEQMTNIALPKASVTNDTMRLKCRKMLENSLAGIDVDIDPELAGCIEDSIFDECKNTGMKYINRIKSRVLNLKDPNNPSLKSMVVAGIISPAKFATMTAEEMASDELKTLRKSYTKEGFNKSQMGSRSHVSQSDMYKCSRCGQRNTSYYQIQILPGDEPMTTYVTCNECGNRWKHL